MLSTLDILKAKGSLNLAMELDTAFKKNLARELENEFKIGRIVAITAIVGVVVSHTHALPGTFSKTLVAPPGTSTP